MFSSFGPQINGVVSQNDDMGLGALQALKEANRTEAVANVEATEAEAQASDAKLEAAKRRLLFTLIELGLHRSQA